MQPFSSPKWGVMVPGVPCVDRGNWGQDLALCEFCGDSPALYLDVAYKDVDHFRKGSVHEL